MTTARALSDNLACLLRREREALAEFVIALADFSRERRWADLGHSSLWYYLHRELGLSAGAASNYKAAAELIQVVPAVAGALRSGQLCRTVVVAAAEVVTAENWEAVLPRFYGRSRREADEIVAELRPDPAPPVRMVVTGFRGLAAPATASPLMDTLTQPDPAGTPPSEATSPGEVTPAVERTPAPHRPEIVPLDAELRRIHLTVSAEFVAKLTAARDLRPDLPVEGLLERGLDLVIDRARRRKGLVDRPLAKPRPSSGPEHVPADVRRAVWERDGGRCVWPLASGGVCGETRGVEFDHVHPRALGGPSTVANGRLLCRWHNREAARRFFGDAVMGRYARNQSHGRKGEPSAAAAPVGGCSASLPPAWG